MASDSRNLRRKSGAVATTANTTTQYVTMQPATSANSQRGNRVATSMSVSRKTTNPLSAELCAEIVETADTNDLSALKQEQTPTSARVRLRRNDAQVIREPQGNKGIFPARSRQSRFFQRRMIQWHDGCFMKTPSNEIEVALSVFNARRTTQPEPLMESNKTSACVLPRSPSE